MENILAALLIMALIFLGKKYGFIPGGFALLIPDVGEVQVLTMALKKATVEAQTLKLYVNDKTPAEGDTAANYTEMSTHGYAAKTLNRADWTVSSAGGITTASQPQQVWTFTAAGAVTVYGYFIIEATSGIILWAERFTTPQVIQYDGDQVKVTPKFTGE
jgi:hypothetical protein